MSPPFIIKYQIIAPDTWTQSTVYRGTSNDLMNQSIYEMRTGKAGQNRAAAHVNHMNQCVNQQLHFCWMIQMIEYQIISPLVTSLTA